MKNTRNTLNNKRQDAKELIKLIEKLPENKKAEVLGSLEDIRSAQKMKKEKKKKQR